MDLELGQSLDTDIWCHNARWVRFACDFSWPIPAFSECVLNPGLFLTSKTFTTDSPGSCIWHLQLYPNGVNDGDSHYVHVALCCKSHFDTMANYFICIQNQDEKLEHAIAASVEIGASTNFTKLSSLLERNLLQQDQNLLPNDTLTITCIIAEKTAVGDKHTVLFERNYFKEEAYYESTTRVILAEDMYTLLESGIFHDVILSAQGHECFAHRIILSTRSPVFGEIFTFQPKQYRIYINNLDSWTLCAMLKYIYSKEHGYLTEETACKLLGAAKMYKLKHLEKTCSTFLTSVITKSNSLKLMRFGYLWKDQELKMAALRFINSFHKDAMGNETWNIMMDCDPDLHNDIVSCLIELGKAQSREKKFKYVKNQAPLVDATEVECFPLHRRRLTWTIEELKQHSSFTHTPTFTTPDFQVSDRSDLRWRIELMVPPKTKQKQSRLSILILRISNNNLNGQIDFVCFVVDKDKKLRELTKGCADNMVTIPFDVADEELLPNDCLTLHFDIKYCHRRTNESTNPVSPTWCVAMNSFVEDLMKLFVNGYGISDVIVVCDGFETRAHKCVLGARSKVLLNLFRGDKHMNRVEIKGVDSALLMELLHYVYTAELRYLTEFTAIRLIAVAKFYDISGLRELCSEFLSSRVTASNALNFLLMAQENGDGRLRMYSMGFVRFHTDVMFPQHSWLELFSKYGLLALEILIGPLP